MKTLQTIALGAALVLSQAHAQTQKAELPAPGQFKVGDEWEWQQVDSRTKLVEGKRSRKVVEVDGIRMFAAGSSRFQIANAFVGDPAKQPWRVWPLEVGKKWVHEIDWKRADGVSGSTKQEVEVVAIEEVLTPAGKFTAYKIEHKGSYSSSTGQGRQNDTYWYSPEALADVKHIRDDGYNMYTRELTVYKRAP